MKIYLMTDLEGVCGVENHDDWVVAGARHYEEGKMLLTMEVNAAIEGFYEAGASEITVADGHGAGGINPALLDPRAKYINRFPGPYPFLLDSSYDAIAWVGQHAKAGTEYAHIAHTGWFDVIDYMINGISVGEFGQIALCAASFGIRSIFCSGDEAMAGEATDLTAGIETVTVKRGLTPGSGDECTMDEYRNRNSSALHLHPTEARNLIRQHSRQALLRLIQNAESFALLRITAPYRRDVRYRGTGIAPAYRTYSQDDSDLIRMLNSAQILIH